MNRVKKIFALIHIPLWTLFCLVIIIQTKGSGDSKWSWTAIGVILTCLYVFYSHLYIISRFYKKSKRTYFLNLAAIIVTGPLPFLIFHYGNMSGPNTITDLYFITLIMAIPGFLFLSLLTRITHNLIINTIKKEELEKQAIQSELYYLKSQINPHFLFNTLNNIHTLVYKQAPTAPEAVMRLSSLMRYMIYESNAPTVSLSREIDYLQDYINLQQLRYKKSGVVEVQIKGGTNLFYIAPLLFIHLLENSYKHSPARLEPGDIKMIIELKKNNLLFKIQNPISKSPVSIEEPGGIGLINIKKRLDILYPNQYELEMNNSEEIFIVILKINNLHTQPYDKETHLLYN